MIIEGETMESYRNHGAPLGQQMVPRCLDDAWRREHPVRAWVRDRGADLVTWRPTSRSTRTAVVIACLLAYVAVLRSCGGGR